MRLQIVGYELKFTIDLIFQLSCWGISSKNAYFLYIPSLWAFCPKGKKVSLFSPHGLHSGFILGFTLNCIYSRQLNPVIIEISLVRSDLDKCSIILFYLICVWDALKLFCMFIVGCNIPFYFPFLFNCLIYDFFGHGRWNRGLYKLQCRFGNNFEEGPSPVQIFSGIQSDCSHLSVGSLSYDSRSTLIRLDLQLNQKPKLIMHNAFYV